jgi:hypothetical protein
MSEVSTAGLDLAQFVFQGHGADASANIVLRKKGPTVEGFGVARGEIALLKADNAFSHWF